MIALLIKASFVSVILLAFYKVFLEKETFYSANRAYLLGSLFLSFALPFVVLPEVIQNQGMVTKFIDAINEKEVIQVENESFTQPNAALSEEPREELMDSAPLNEPATATDSSSLSAAKETSSLKKGLGFWMMLIYLFGVCVLSLNLLGQIANMIWKVIKSNDRIVSADGVIVNMNGKVEPCSFFRYIFINPACYDYNTYEQILEHEKIHVNKMHSIDLLLSELAVIFLWFNPFVWILRKEVEKNIEYQTDDILISKNSEVKQEYQMNLVKIACYQKPLTITTNYNQSLIKQRIMKMNNKKSNRFGLWKYTFLAPTILVILLVLNKPIDSIAQLNKESTQASSNAIDTTDENYKIRNDIKERKSQDEGKVNLHTTTTTTSLPNGQSSSITKIGDKTYIVGERTYQYKGKTYNKKDNIVRVIEEDGKTYTLDESHTIEKILDSAHEKSRKNYSLTNSKSANNTHNVDKHSKDSRVNKHSIVTTTSNPFGSTTEQTELILKDGKTYIKSGNQLVLIEQDGEMMNEIEDEMEGDPFGHSSTMKNTTACKSLLKAIREGDLARIKKLIGDTDVNCFDRNPDFEVMMEDSNGDYMKRSHARTPLTAAARSGNLTIGKLLEQAGAKIDHHENHASPLSEAAQEGHMEFVLWLLEKGANVNSRSGPYGSPLSSAAYGGRNEIVKLLLDKGAKIQSSGGAYGNALNSAACGGHDTTVALLLDKGADIDAKGGAYGTALNTAANNGHTKTLQLLIEKGANLESKGGAYGTALNTAANNGHLASVEYLVEKGANLDAVGGAYGTALNTAANNGHTEVIELLLAKGANTEVSGGAYGTALNTAANNGHTNTINLLLDKGANVNSSGGAYGTALGTAANNGHLATVKLLIEKGADINRMGGSYGTALNTAANNGHIDVINYLLEKGADVNRSGGAYGTALNTAANNGHTEVIKLLLEKDANVNANGGAYGTALSTAANNGHMSTIKLLLSKGADVNARGGAYGTALATAANNGHIEVIKYLVEKGADVNAQGGGMGTALDIAFRNRDKKMISYLESKGAE